MKESTQAPPNDLVLAVSIGCLVIGSTVIASSLALGGVLSLCPTVRWPAAFAGTGLALVVGGPISYFLQSVRVLKYSLGFGTFVGVAAWLMFAGQ